MNLLATIRPDDWNIALLLHVLGSMILVGALVLSASALLFAWSSGTVSLVRLGYRSLLLGALPAWILMRVGAEWIASKEDLTDAKLSWLDVGFTTADAGILVLLIATAVGGLASRRATRAGGWRVLGRTSALLVSVLLVAYLVAVWAMTTKPT